MLYLILIRWRAEFNKIVVGCMQVIEVVVQNNMNKDQLEDFLANVRKH